MPMKVEGEPLIFSYMDWVLAKLTGSHKLSILKSITESLPLTSEGMELLKNLMLNTISLSIPADIIALMDTLELATAHIVGLSMGGMVAFQLAVDAPERLRTMTIVNSGPALPNDTFAAKKMLWSRFIMIHLFGMKWFAKKVAGNMFVSD